MFTNDPRQAYASALTGEQLAILVLQALPLPEQAMLYVRKLTTPI